VKYLPLSRREPEDLEVRLELQLASWLAYFGPKNTPMGLSHELGRRIGASYDVPHGITSCIILAPSLQVLEERIPGERWRGLAEGLGGDPAEIVSSLVEELGLPGSLREVGVPGEDLESMAGEYGERVGEVREILKVAY
jgi:alcohol dehydrogenase class IV